MHQIKILRYIRIPIPATLAILVMIGCKSNSVMIQNPGQLHGKRIGMGQIDIIADKKAGLLNSKDTICACIGQSVRDVLIRYLQQSGFVVIDIPADRQSELRDIPQIADSMKLTHVFTGRGTVQLTGSTYFLHSFTGSLLNLKTMETPLSVSYSSIGIRVVPAAESIGKEIVKKMH